MSQHNWNLRCGCGLPLRFERDLRGGVREWCTCGFEQPLEKRAAPPLDRVLPRGPVRLSEGDRREYHRKYYHDVRKVAV